MNLLVFGGRLWNNQQSVADALTHIHSQYVITKIILGSQTNPFDQSLMGSDKCAAHWAGLRAIPTDLHSPDSDKHPTLSYQDAAFDMVYKGLPDLAVRFPGEQRTKCIARQLNFANVPIRVISARPPELTEEEKEGRRLLAELAARPPKPHLQTSVVARARPKMPHGMEVSYYAERPRGPQRLTGADRYELWLSRQYACPHCKKWHWPGTRHRYLTEEETLIIDEQMAARHEAELNKVKEKQR